MLWGLLGPETLSNQRRTRTLGLGAAVRLFNDLAVPGLGGVWFGKQLVLATLGLALAERAREEGINVRNIEAGNAVEALACWLALKSNGRKSDPRVRGALKLRAKTDMSFSSVRKRGFYVTQPMRMSTVQPLRTLGLVKGASERFNAYQCTAAGHEFIEMALKSFRPKNRSVLDNLLRWVKGDDTCVTTDKVRDSLSPLEPLAEAAREFLLERLIEGSGSDAARRRTAIAWMDDLRRKIPSAPLSWERKPKHIEDDHWLDLRSGGRFFQARDAAIAALDAVEAHIGCLSHRRLELNNPTPFAIGESLEQLGRCARRFLAEEHDPSRGLAREFCEECSSDDPALALEFLIRRDGRVLRFTDTQIIPGPAFRGLQTPQADNNEGDEDYGVSAAIQWPEGVSSRIDNLFWMNIDLHGELDTRLATAGRGAKSDG